MQKKDKEKAKKLRYDPVDGLMPEIRRVCGHPHYIKPEAKDAAKNKKKAAESEVWTMPEAQNCGFCSIGGNILCCETCPASFHYACLGVEESDLPDDKYFCNRCKNMPKEVFLYPPEKCCPSTSPTIRIGNENQRNWETIKWHYDRLREEASNGPGPSQAGPLNEAQAFRDAFPDRFMVQALGMANPMDFNLPPEYLLEREAFPLDALEEKRPILVGIKCTKCQLQDEWSPMLSCDFCSLPWHQKCVNTPLVSLPRMSYWRCPNHTETLLDSVWNGDQVSRNKRRKVYAKYNKEKKQRGEKQFKSFIRNTWKDRMEGTFQRFKDQNEYLQPTFFAPEDKTRSDDLPPTFLMMANPENSRKGDRVKKNQESRLLAKKYAPLYPESEGFGAFGIPGNSTQKTAKNKKKLLQSGSVDGPLDSQADDERSHRFTDEELIMSVMPFDEHARNEFLSIKTMGMDMDSLAQFFARHSTMIMRSRLFYSYFSQYELTKLMRRDLDPLESVRGSGTQTIQDYHEKTARKKLKGDIESLIQLIGFGNAHSERRFSTARTEAFFRRSNPPPSALEALNPGTLREVVLSSQKEALELHKVYRIFSQPQNLENLILLAFDTVHGSLEDRDSFFPSSMTIWSKEPVISIVNKDFEEKWAFEKQEEAKRREEDKEEEEEEDFKDDSMDREREEEEEEDRPESPKDPSPSPGTSDYPVDNDPMAALLAAAQLEEEEEIRQFGSLSSPPCTSFEEVLPKEEVKEEEAPETKQEDPTYSELESQVRQMADSLSKVVVSPKPYKDKFIFVTPSLDTIWEPERDFDEHYSIPFVDRRTQSCSDLDYNYPMWPEIRRRLREDVRRFDHTQAYEEHNYSQLEETLHDFTDDDLDPEERTPPVDLESFVYTWQVPIELERREIPAASISTSTSRSTSFSVTKRKRSANAGMFGKRRGRPPGSKNRKDGEPVAPPKQPKRSPARGGGAPKRGGRGGRRGGRVGRGGGRGRGVPRPSISEQFIESSSLPGCSTSSDLLPAAAAPEETKKGLKKQVEDLRQKIVKKLLAKSLQEEKSAYFETRDEALEHWTRDDWLFLSTRCFQDRLTSLIPYEPRYFLPNQRVHAKLDLPGIRLPIAIQRCLTKIGIARDCHLRIDYLTDAYCSVLADYHCDIVRDYFSDTFYLSTLGTEHVIVDGKVVRRQQLSALEQAEQMRFKKSPFLPSNMKCRCQKISDHLIATQENSGTSINSGIIQLATGAHIQIGCAHFTFVKC